jgi:predicted phosphodiesterase
MSQPIYILGDIHGNWSGLFQKIRDYEIKDSTIISVGDIGIGFIPNAFEEKNNFFKDRNITFMGIRGNHDDPSYFGRIAYPNFKLLPDYHTEVLNGQRFLFVGGAISIDRTGPERVSGESWWIDEVLNFNEDKIVECDVLVTHSMPT